MARHSKQSHQRSSGDIRNALGDDDEFSIRRAAPPKRQRPSKASGKDEFSKARLIEESKKASEVMSIRPAFHALGDLFVTQPWIHTYRGATQPLPTLKVSMGPVLIAKLISEQVRSDNRLKGMTDQQIEETVEYAMKHFFDRVPNEERSSSGLVRRFLHEDWWDHLIEESIDHFKMLRTPMPDWEESQQRVVAFYENWPKKETSVRPKNVKEAAARFNEIYARYVAEQEAAYTDEEPLT